MQQTALAGSDSARRTWDGEAKFRVVAIIFVCIGCDKTQWKSCADWNTPRNSPGPPISACGIVTDIPTKCHAGKFVSLGGSLPWGWIRQAKPSSHLISRELRSNAKESSAC